MDLQVDFYELKLNLASRPQPKQEKHDTSVPLPLQTNRTCDIDSSFQGTFVMKEESNGTPSNDLIKLDPVQKESPELGGNSSFACINGTWISGQNFPTRLSDNQETTEKKVGGKVLNVSRIDQYSRLDIQNQAGE